MPRGNCQLLIGKNYRTIELHVHYFGLLLIRPILILSFLLLWLVPVAGIAQETISPPWIVPGVQGGVEGGVVLNQVPFIVDNHNLGEVPYLRLSGGVSAVFPLLFSPGFGLSVRGNWAGVMGWGTARGVEDVLVDTVTVTRVELEHGYAADIHELTLDVLYYIHTGDVMRLEVGPWLGYRYQGTYTQTAKVLAPQEFSFQGKKEMTVVSDSEFEVEGVAYGAALNISAEIPFGSLGSLVPFLTLRTDVSLPDRDNRWVPLSGGIGFGWLFGQTIDRKVFPEVVIPDPVPVLQAGIDLYSQDETGAKRDTLFLYPAGTLHLLTIPFIPCIPCRPEVTAETSLSVFDTIGSRLSRTHYSRLYLSGRGDSLFWEDAGRIAADLNRRWQIEKSRIVADSAKAVDTFTGDCLSLRSDHPEILAPLHTQWIGRRYTPGPVRLRPDIIAEAGVHSWRMEVRKEDREVAVMSDKESNGGLSSAALTFDVHDRTSSGLNVEFIVTDSLGSSIAAVDTLPVRFAEGETATIDGEEPVDTVRIWMIPTSEQEMMSGVIEEVAGYVADDTGVTIRSFEPEMSENYSDVVGSWYDVRDRFNQQLAAKGNESPEIFVIRTDKMPFGMRNILPKEYLDMFWILIELTRQH